MYRNLLESEKSEISSGSGMERVSMVLWPLCDCLQCSHWQENLNQLLWNLIKVNITKQVKKLALDKWLTITMFEHKPLTSLKKTWNNFKSKWNKFCFDLTTGSWFTNFPCALPTSCMLFYACKAIESVVNLLLKKLITLDWI